jgi:hypothetical protein
MLLLELINTKNVKNVKKSKSKIVSKKRLIIATVLGIIAACLSWNCNTLAGYRHLEKVLYAFFAFLFGGVYIILYLIFRANSCGVVRG